LSIRIVRDGNFEKFYLVKDATVTPQRGRTVNIPVEESFTLPAGQTHYSFSLQQGEGNKELQFVAYLKSPAFPLKKATACKLKMTYTYGADDPYELKFIPLDSAEAGFKSIRVEWRSVAEGKTTGLENLPVPDFPARKTWSDFQKFPKEDGKSFSDLLDWVERMLKSLDRLDEREIRKQISRTAQRHNNQIKKLNGEINGLTENWKRGEFVFGKNDQNGEYFCIVEVEGERVFCHSSSFSSEIDAEDLYEGDDVYLLVSTGRDGKLNGRYLTSNKERPEYVTKEIEKLRHEITYLSQKRQSKDMHDVISESAESARKAIFSLRFPALTIWNHDHSLSESDVPDHFRNAIFEGTQRILSIIESENMPDTLKEELFFFLCCLHKDAPEYVGKRLIEMSDDPIVFLKCNRNISFAIGNAGLPWQKKLLDKVLNSKHPIALEMLAIAIWRSEVLIHKLSKSKLKGLSKILLNATLADLESISSEVQQDRVDRLVEKGLTEEDAVERERGYQVLTLCKHLELLLALLRSRGNEEEGFKMVFAPENDLTKKYGTLVDDVSRIVIDSDIELKSRISLQIEKPEMFDNTPDLLYALQMYLTGDSGANTIVITGVSDEDG
ncbi:MAG: hypothetical protein PHE87_04815, partial [Victivallaceae bacterium]|nr:hypothetical protein [Victivallaceae bacterium]